MKKKGFIGGKEGSICSLDHNDNVETNEDDKVIHKKSCTTYVNVNNGFSNEYPILKSPHKGAIVFNVFKVQLLGITLNLYILWRARPTLP